MSRQKTILTVTSIPRRFDTSLPIVVRSLALTSYPIVVSLPGTYNKWGSHPPPAFLANIKNVSCYVPTKDYGPATKLLGALEYAAKSMEPPDNVITFDDDCIYSDPGVVIAALEQAALQRPNCVITFGGIKLDRPPFTSKNGLFHNNSGHVDAVVGWRGVLYPTQPLIGDRRIFDMMDEMPTGMVHDDDVFFGIAMSRLGVPVYAIRSPKMMRDGRKLAITELSNAGPSGVQEAVAKDRRLNEGELFQHAVKHGWLPSSFSIAERTSSIEVALRRNRLGRKIVNVVRR